MLPCYGQALAQTHEAHEQGVARLDLAVEDGGFDIDIDSPLASFISFEHAPSTPEQRAEVSDMVAKLSQAGSLFETPAAAGCQVRSVSLSSENIPADLLGEFAAKPGAGEGHNHEASEADHDHDGEGDHVHGDIEAGYVFECADISELNSLKVNLFSRFPGLTEIEARVVSDKGQASQELTPGQFELRW
jgi:hypothetical protein